MNKENIFSISIIRMQEGGQRQFRGVSFHIKEISTAAGLAEVSVLYLELDLAREKFLSNARCKGAGGASWYICEWTPN